MGSYSLRVSLTLNRLLEAQSLYNWSFLGEGVAHPLSPPTTNSTHATVCKLITDIDITMTKAGREQALTTEDAAIFWCFFGLMRNC